MAVENLTICPTYYTLANDVICAANQGAIFLSLMVFH